MRLNVTLIQLSFFRIYKNHGKSSIVTLAARFNKNSKAVLVVVNQIVLLVATKYAYSCFVCTS